MLLGLLKKKKRTHCTPFKTNWKGFPYMLTHSHAIKKKYNMLLYLFGEKADKKFWQINTRCHGPSPRTIPSSRNENITTYIPSRFHSAKKKEDRTKKKKTRTNSSIGKRVSPLHLKVHAFEGDEWRAGSLANCEFSQAKCSSEFTPVSWSKSSAWESSVEQRWL